jgi:hypothetical protein
MSINDCIRLLKDNVKNKYAQAYLQNLPDAIDQGGTSGLCVQLLYVLDNAKDWKGDDAKKVKAAVRKWVKERNKDEK